MTSHHTEVHCKIFIGERMNKHAVCQLKKCRSVCSRLVHNLPINYQAESVIVEELSPLLVWPAASAERFSAEQTGGPAFLLDRPVHVHVSTLRCVWPLQAEA